MTDTTFTPAAASLLSDLAGPDAVRRLPAGRLPELAAQIREFLIDAVARTGGHLGPNLGVVELTIALHRVFDSPRDVLLFDTGHQAYVHKLLTGRQEGFGRLRRAGGLSGYPARSESAHDWIENSHASTALSYADGLAKAFAVRGERGRGVVAVVGDGALTGGMAFEALNNLGAAADRPVVVVLNDNGRSYAPTTGALAAHLARLTRPAAGSGAASRPGNVFESLGLAYLGPVDGHDIAALEAALSRARELRRPVVVHCLTAKGKGFVPAETDDADRLHAVGVVDPATGRPCSAGAPSWTEAFAAEAEILGAERDDLVFLTAAMLRPTGLHPAARAFPGRVFDVGIAEQHAVTSAAGLAMGGLHPVVAVYSTFLNRAFDQVMMDVALHRLPVTFVLDRAGVTGEDGPSHHGMWDLGVLGGVPGMRVAAPRDGATLRLALREAVAHRDGPTAIRFPKGPLPAGLPAEESYAGFDVLRRPSAGVAGRSVVLVTVGAMAQAGCAAAALLEEAGAAVTVLDPRWIQPLSSELLELTACHDLVATVEDGSRMNGFGSRLALALHDAGARVPVRILGLPTAFLPQGRRDAVLAACGLTASGIAEAVRNALPG
jgi:1-deoxy-D-xylulose-5-phosphate synthase